MSEKELKQPKLRLFAKTAISARRGLSLGGLLLVLTLPTIAASEPCSELCNPPYSGCTADAAAYYESCTADCDEAEAVARLCPGHHLGISGAACLRARLRLLRCKPGICLRQFIASYQQCVAALIGCQKGTVCPPTRTVTRTATPGTTPSAVPPGIQSSTPTPTPTHTPPVIP